jgi:hypothetical protein
MKAADLPLPVAPIFHAPMMATAPGPVYRATIVLAVAYWRAGCALPTTDDVTLASLCRLPLAHLRPIKPAVMAALAEITPALDYEHERLIRSHEYKSQAAQRMRDGKAMRQAVRALQQQSAQAPVPLPLPTRAPAVSPWHGSAGTRRQSKQAGATVTFAATFRE